MSSSNSERPTGEGEAVDKHVVEHPKLEQLKKLRENFILKIESHRYPFLHEFKLLIRDWKEQLPNLHDFFTKQEIDWILMASIKWSSRSGEIVEFVARGGYKDEPDLDEDGKPVLRRTTAVHQIDECNSRTSKGVVLIRLFEIYDKFHVNYTDELGYSHFHMACKYGLHDVAEKFLELGQDPICPVPETGDSMLYFVAATNSDYPMEATILTLLKYGADPSQANKDGRTILHGICQSRNHATHSVISMLLECFDEFQLTVQINAQDKRGDTPLHLALRDGHDEWTILKLLRRGANPNSANARGQTPLHVICQSYWGVDLLREFFDVCDEIRQVVLLDDQNNEGNTPLHLAISYGDARMVESLLRRGADPTLANAEGLTPLHIICQRFQSRNLLDPFFDVCDEKREPVLLDARDNEGNTPLHLAISYGDARMVETLLRRGADPTLASAEGQAPLHLIATRDVSGDMIRIFLRINAERQRKVQIDARDDWRRTALEWAVVNCLPMAVESLLDCGADVSGFVFPTPSNSEDYGDIILDNIVDFADYDLYVNDLDRGSYLSKLTTATGLLAIVELLETRGYEMGRDDALKLMGFFDKYGLYESTDFSASTDVDDSVDSIFEEMAKNPTYMDDYEFARSYKLRKLPKESRKACSLRLCEKISRKFFRDWALDPFMQLIHYRLPIDCCKMIMEKLKNKDLFNICLAASDRTRIEAAAEARADDNNHV